MIVESAVANPVKVAVGVLLVALFGTLALFRMPMQLTPEVERPTITIETRWPGASPQEVEREVVQEQEEQLKGVEGVIKMTGECMDSMGRITLEFQVGTDMNELLVKVNARLQQVPEYPEDADEPVIQTASSSAQPIAWFILRPRVASRERVREFRERHPELADELEPVLRAHNTGLRLRRIEDLAKEHPAARELLPPDIDINKMRRFAEDTIEARFERVPGVANSNVLGGREDELQVLVDPQKLAARQLTIDEVRMALRRRNVDTSGGDYWEGKRRYVVRTLGQFDNPEQVAGVVISRRDGLPVYVSDVAEVRLGYKKPDGIVRNFGTTSLAVNCIRETGANVLEIMEGLREARRDLQEGILKDRGLQLEQVYDETDYIESSIDLVQQNILVGGSLAILALLLFLRSARSTLVIALAIPISIVGAFLILALLGRTLNVVSLAGLAFAVGMLVDNAVVVLENIWRHAQRGASAFQAAIQGTKEVGGAVFASTMTTLAIFIPVVFVEEEAGQLFEDIALAISASVGLSLLVSLLVISCGTARILPKDGEFTKGGRVRRFLGGLVKPLDSFAHGFSSSVVRLNSWLQRSVLRQLAAILLLVGLALYGSFALLPKVEYLPTGNRNLVFGILLPPPGYNLDELLAIGERIEERMRPYWDVDPGSPEAEELAYPAIGDWFYVARGRQLFMGIRAADPLRSGGLVPLLEKVTGGEPGMIAIAKQASLFERGLSAGRTVDVEISGPKLEHLVELGRQTMGTVMQVLPNGRAFPKPSLDLSNPEVHVLPRWEQTADVGFTSESLGYAVDALVDGAYAADYYAEGEKIDLTIIGKERFADRLQDLPDLPVATPSGDLVPLSAVADVELSSGPEQINRRERERTITIEVTPPIEVALEDAMDRIRERIVEPMKQEGKLEGGFRINLAGTADKLRATWASLRANFLLALLITYLLLAAIFESWLYPFVIVLSVPLGAVGGIAGLKLLNEFVVQPLDVLTMLGFIILVGTVVNNAILIVHQSLNLTRGGKPEREAILESVRTRMRPIFMTVSTTVFGLLPLVFFPGAGSELYRGLGAVLIGGLLVSTIFTLVLVPTLFHLTMQAKAAIARRVGVIEADRASAE